MKELTLEEVKIYVLEHFCEYLPECYQKSTLRVESAVKNNQGLTGISLAGVKISPTIYLEHIYEEYLEHKEDLCQILRKKAKLFFERMKDAVLLKPRTDNRDGQREIKSRMGLAAPAEYVDNFLKEISKSWSETDTEYRYQGKKVDAILIDEAQFLSAEEVDTLSDIVDFYEIPVLCYGLWTDFLNHLFPGSRLLMEIADVIEEVPTVCWCSKFEETS